MAIDQLNHMVESAKQLSPDELKVASQRILDILDDMERDESLKN